MSAADLLNPTAIYVTRPRDLPPLAVGLRDATRLLGVSERHLWKLAVSGAIPSVMIGNRRVFRLTSLEQWLKDHEQSGRRRPEPEAGDGV